MPNQQDQNAFNIASSGSAQENFERVAGLLESLIDQRDADVKTAMANHQADGSSEEYAGKEVRWNTVANEVRRIISILRLSLTKADDTAAIALGKAKTAVDAI